MEKKKVFRVLITDTRSYYKDVFADDAQEAEEKVQALIDEDTEDFSEGYSPHDGYRIVDGPEEIELNESDLGEYE